MKAKRILAIFKGTNNQLGFRKGQEYRLVISESRGGMYVRGLYSRYSVWHSEMESFLNNWTNIKN